MKPLAKWFVIRAVSAEERTRQQPANPWVPGQYIYEDNSAEMFEGMLSCTKDVMTAKRYASFSASKADLARLRLFDAKFELIGLELREGGA